MEENGCFSHLKSMIGKAVFLLKTNSILTEKKCARCSCFYLRWFSFKRYMCFLNSAEQSCLEQNVPFLPLKTLIGRQYSFQKLTHFSQVNKVQHASAAKMVFFREVHVFLQLS
jgi:hypothetical protein